MRNIWSDKGTNVEYDRFTTWLDLSLAACSFSFRWNRVPQSTFYSLCLENLSLPKRCDNLLSLASS